MFLHKYIFTKIHYIYVSPPLQILIDHLTSLSNQHLYFSLFKTDYQKETNNKNYHKEQETYIYLK